MNIGFFYGKLLWPGSDPHPVFLGNPICLPEAAAAAWRHNPTFFEVRGGLANFAAVILTTGLRSFDPGASD